jgi:transcriptional regulator with XRE-family HTH domain
MLRTARRRAGLTQQELARRAGVPQPTISRIERGVVSPSMDTLDHLLRESGMEIELMDRPKEDAVDRSLIREMLTKTPAERARYAVRAANVMRPLIGIAKPAQ